MSDEITKLTYEEFQAKMRQDSLSAYADNGTLTFESIPSYLSSGDTIYQVDGEFKTDAKPMPPVKFNQLKWRLRAPLRWAYGHIIHWRFCWAIAKVMEQRDSERK